MKRITALVFLICIIYPVFWYMDRVVISPQNSFWHSYAQDLMMPGFYVLLFATIIPSPLSIVLAVGVAELFLGVFYEFGQSAQIFPGTADKLDVLCYAVSIMVAMLIFITVPIKDEHQKVP